MIKNNGYSTLSHLTVLVDVQAPSYATSEKRLNGIYEHARHWRGAEINRHCLKSVSFLDCPLLFPLT
jgi:hypothetical protein